MEGFSAIGEVLRRTVPAHVPYTVHYGARRRGWTKKFEIHG
jgi:hypothetical protein